MKKLLLTFAIIVGGISAANAQKTSVKIHDTQARTVDVSPTTYVKPLTVELEVSANGKVTDVWPLSKKQVEEEMGGVLENIRSWGLYASCQKWKADVIVAPIFNFKTNDEGDGYILTVIGFPATFKNWRTATENDYEWIRLEKTQTTTSRENIQAIIRE